MWREKWSRVSANTDWWALVNGLVGSQGPGKSVVETGRRWSGEEECGWSSGSRTKYEKLGTA